MKAVLLAGGFGTRLLPLTANTPKGLLPVAGKPIIGHVFSRILPLKPTRTYVLTNTRFGPAFEAWAAGLPDHADVRVVIENSTNERDKLGSVGALGQVIERERLSDDVLVVAADNLFTCGLEGVRAVFEQRGMPVVALYDVQKKEAAKRFGVVELDRAARITAFLEKPESPPSSLVSTGIYFLPRRVLPLVLVYLKEGRNPDHFGNFIAWLAGRTDVAGCRLPPGAAWHDIGSPEAYARAQAEFSRPRPGA